MNNILFVDIDSTIPNIALMKLARYHINAGDNVFLKHCNNPDKVYVSCIFEKNAKKAIGTKKLFNCKVEIGGYYVDKNKILPDDVEHLKPYYNLYQNCESSYGFTTRGCIRKCPFCIVWRKEGYVSAYEDIYNFLDRRYKKITLLDNNILALPEHFFKVSQQIIDENLTVDFNQGLDIRLMTEDIAKRLKQLSKVDLRFAFDNLAYEKQVIKGCKILLKEGIKSCMFYVLVGFDTTLKEDIYRINKLTELKQRAYVMQHKNSYHLPIYKDLKGWVNGGQFQTVMSFEQYQKVKRDKSWGNKKILYKKETLENY